MNTDEIKACIPHRDPFLWLDEVTEISDTHIVARKVLSADLPVFQGHYPNFPVFPGVLQCEACFQAGAVLISRLVPTGTDDVPVVTRLNNVQFRKMIRPGETIELHVELTARLANACYLKGKVMVRDTITNATKVTARLEFVCAAAAIEA